MIPNLNNTGAKSTTEKEKEIYGYKNMNRCTSENARRSATNIESMKIKTLENLELQFRKLTLSFAQSRDLLKMK